MTYEVDRPIQNSPFDAPSKHRYIQRGRDPKRVDRQQEPFVNKSASPNQSRRVARATLRDDHVMSEAFDVVAGGDDVMVAAERDG